MNIIDEVINDVRELLKLFVKRKTSFVILDKISHVVVLSKYLIGNLFILLTISHLIWRDILAVKVAFINHCNIEKIPDHAYIQTRKNQIL